MIFVTESGSTYELDAVLKKVRRLKGKNDPSPRQGEDGVWKDYDSVSSIAVGYPVLFVWVSVNDDVSVGAFPGTLTSRVEEILGDLN